ncbi:MAG TPA: hypothetical protein VKA26_02640 [Ignavibacteriaceae bacterium]|nr:hypothetical protein [Ignavibacteriaceae bacterium]
MNKKVWTGFIVVFIVYFLLDWLINGVLLQSSYMAEEVAKLMRPEAEIQMWIIIVCDLFYAFFFTLIFSKGFENKGIMEGARYGLYVGLMVSLPMAYGTYAVMPVPYSLAMQWFLYGLAVNIICGVVLTFIFKTKAAA